MKNIAKSIKELLLHNSMAVICTVIFIIVSLTWLATKPFNQYEIVSTKHFWSSSYVLLSFLGSIFGFIISRNWGGYKSLLGRALMFFSLGLALQSFGQIVYNYYTLVAKIEAPYPSLGDIGYFGSIPAYIIGAYLLGRVAGLKISIKSFGNQILALLLPLLMLVISYSIFLKDYQIDNSKPLNTILDFGYPFGQAIYVSITLLVLLLTRKILGGVMRKPVLILLIALVVQYICDFDFLYKFNHETWYAGGPGDYLYAVSYFVMCIAIIYIGGIFNKIKNS